MGTLCIEYMQNPLFCIALSKADGKRNSSAFTSELQKCLGIMLFFRYAPAPENTFVAVHLHITVHQPESQPHKRIEPVQNQNQNSNAFDPGVAVADMSALML